MKPYYFLSLLVLLFNNTNAQDEVVTELKKEAEIIIVKDPKDTVQKVWKTGGTFTLNINQGSLSNWSAGGDEFSFSLNSFVNVFAFYKKERRAWDNNLDMAFGIVQTTSLGRRKSSDRFDFTSKFGYSLNPKLNLSSLVNLRSQFANGFHYSKTAEGKDTAKLTSRSWMPTYLIVSQGFDYKPVKNLSIYFSPITARWIMVADPLIRPLYGVDANKNARAEFGAFISANYTAKIGKQFTYKSKIELFSNYKKNPQNIDVFWTNSLTGKITKLIQFSLNVDMIYDDDTKNVKPGKGPAPQWLQLMGIGFTYPFGHAKNKSTK
jgi:hypothetical protein